MSMVDPGPAPWDLPPVAPVPPRPKRRGTSGPKREAQLRAIRAKVVRKDETVGLSDCPTCGTLVLYGRAAGWTVTVDIWQVPYPDACVLSRYRSRQETLWMTTPRLPNQLHYWDEWSNSSALLNHHCTVHGPDAWWNRGPYLGSRNDYVKDDVYL